ncbi:MAG: hypothetical protein V1914_04915 [archaeon]
MKLKNILTAGAITLATILGNATPARAHETIKHPGEYKIVLEKDMNTWKAIEYVLYGKNKGSKRSNLQQRLISEALVGAYKHNLFRHQLKELDKHTYHNPNWNKHMELIKRMRSDNSGYGELPDLDWVNRNEKSAAPDGLAMDLKPGDSFYMTASQITNEELAELLDKKDGNRDHVIHADGRPVHFKKKDKPRTPELPRWLITPEIPERTDMKEPHNLSGALTAGYLNENLNGQTFMQGPKFDLDFDYTTSINDNWNLTIDTDNEFTYGLFNEGSATILNLEGAVLFNYELTDNLEIGAGPRVSLLNANINYAGNQAELTDFAGGAEATAKLETEYVDATLDYSFNLGVGGDNFQGFNPITQHKVDLETTLHLNPLHFNAGYEFQHDTQNIRGVSRNNLDHTLEASVDLDITDNLTLTAGYELNIHEGDANNTLTNTATAGVKIRY